MFEPFQKAGEQFQKIGKDNFDAAVPAKYDTAAPADGLHSKAGQIHGCLCAVLTVPKAVAPKSARDRKSPRKQAASATSSEVKPTAAASSWTEDAYNHVLPLTHRSAELQSLFAALVQAGNVPGASQVSAI